MSIRRTKISYSDFSGGDLNFVLRGQRGDCETSAGCKNCYALRIFEHFGTGPESTTAYPDKLARLVTADFACRKGNPPFRRGKDSRPIAFPVDMGDLFHHLVPSDFIAWSLTVMDYRRDVDWLVLTKRPRRALSVWNRLHRVASGERFGDVNWPSRFIVSSSEQEMVDDTKREVMGRYWPPNIWLGVSVEDEDNLWRIPVIVQIPAAIIWLSLEPMLGRIDLDMPVWMQDEQTSRFHWLEIVKWIALGGESGPDRRPFDKQWAREVRDKCQEYDVPFFFKQGSAMRPDQDHLLDGRRWREFPMGKSSG